MDTNRYGQHQYACFPIECNAGYELVIPDNNENGDLNYCLDIDECALRTHDCTESQFCHNHEGSFSCETCDVGFTTNEVDECMDANECSNGVAACGSYGQCVNTEGTYTCDCNDFYVVNEDPNDLCSVYPGMYNNYHQACRKRFCENENECETGNHDCPVEFNCYDKDP